MYLGDYSTGSTVFFAFTTVNSSGVPTAFSSGGVTAYRDASTVANTTGITLTASFAGVTGLNQITVEMAGTSTFYLPGGEYRAVISSGAASEILAGYVLAHWSIIRGTPVTVSTAVSISTASLISTSNVFASVASVTGNVVGSVGSVASATGIATAVWGATRSSYTAAGSFGESVSTGSSIAAVVAVGSTVQADVALWRGTAPSTLGTGAFLVPSSTAAILSVVSVGSTVQADVGLWRGIAPSTLGPNSNLQVSTATLISTAQTIASVGAVTDALSEPTSGPPQAAPTPAQAWAWMHYTLRHQIRVNSSNKTFFNSSGVVLWTKGLLGDSATYTELIGSTST